MGRVVVGAARGRLFASRAASIALSRITAGFNPEGMRPGLVSGHAHTKREEKVKNVETIDNPLGVREREK